MCWKVSTKGRMQFNNLFFTSERFPACDLAKPKILVDTG